MNGLGSSNWRGGKKAGGPIAFLFAASTALIVWACGGSGTESYYCDDFACYQCTGETCVEARPTPNPACDAGGACPSGRTCTDQGCLIPCDTSSTCGTGTVCKTGFCVAPSAVPPSVQTKSECTTSATCGKGKRCEAERCVPCGGSNGPCPCAATADCQAGQTCGAGLCRSEASSCRYASACAEGAACYDGVCVSECGAGRACTSGTCASGVCRPAGGDSCASSCGATSVCAAGTCVPRCDASRPCAQGQSCEQGACLENPRAQALCTSDKDCASEAGRPARRCVEGACRYSCDTDATCAMIDSRIGWCGKDKVCRSQVEARAECVGNGDCGSGKACVDNVCR